VLPAPVELCDGVDNDCNGAVDDGIPGLGAECDTGLLGVCAEGTVECAEGGQDCVPVNVASPEVCGDGLDNDCDGSIDDGCPGAFTGVMTDVPVAELTGWTQCFQDLYSASGETTLAEIETQCSGAKLLLGCRAVGASTLRVAAWAPREDVLFDTGQSNTPHDANGVGWYFSPGYSWGFAPQGDTINRNSCDIVASSLSGSGADGDKRLCWHTSSGALNAGWRCGTTDSIFGSTYERVIFQAD